MVVPGFESKVHNLIGLEAGPCKPVNEPLFLIVTRGQSYVQSPLKAGKVRNGRHTATASAARSGVIILRPSSESDNGTQFPLVPKRLGDYARFTVAEELGDAVTALAQALHAFNPQN
jgi:hypothetical protein